MNSYLIIKEALVDLRREATPAQLNQIKDPLQESQLLFGETALGKKEQEGSCGSILKQLNNYALKKIKVGVDILVGCRI